MSATALYLIAAIYCWAMLSVLLKEPLNFWMVVLLINYGIASVALAKLQ